MTTISLQTILAAIPSRVIAVLRDHEHSASDLVRHLTFCYAMLPVTPQGVRFDGEDQNRLCREFCRDYCGEDGAVNWEKLLALNVGTGVEAGDELETIPAERCQDCNAELSQCGPQDSDGEPTLDCKECQLRDALRESEAGAAALREALELVKAEAGRCMQEVQEVGHTEFAYTVGMAVAVNNALSTVAGRELLAEVERLREEVKDLTSRLDRAVLNREQWETSWHKDTSVLRAERDSLQRKVKAAEGMAQALEIASRETYLTAQDGYKPTPTAIVCRAALTAWQEVNK